MITKSADVRAITTSDAPENAPGDMLLVRVPLASPTQFVLIDGWALIGCSVVGPWANQRGYADAVYAFCGVPS